MIGASETLFRKNYQLSSPYGSIGSNSYNCVRNAACNFKQAAFLFRPVGATGRGWIEFPDPSKKSRGPRLTLGPRRKRFPMFPDPKDYAVQLKNLGLDPTDPKAVDLVFLLAGYLGPFADGTHPDLSPDCADSGALFVTRQTVNVVKSEQDGAGQRLSCTFENAAQKPPPRKEPL